MNCIYCDQDTKVTNSRPQKRANSIWRRRECKNCHTVFTSIEKADLTMSIMVIKNNVLQPFSRDKLLLSIHDSLKHRKTATEDATALTDTVVGQVLTQVEDASLPVILISKTTFVALQRFDRVAATHYQAFHPT